jgi:hypothetical protein
MVYHQPVLFSSREGINTWDFVIYEASTIHNYPNSYGELAKPGDRWHGESPAIRPQQGLGRRQLEGDQSAMDDRYDTRGLGESSDAPGAWLPKLRWSSMHGLLLGYTGNHLTYLVGGLEHEFYDFPVT